MKYGWLYDHTRQGWLHAASIVVFLVIGWRYGMVAVALAMAYGLLLAAYVIRGVEESDVEDGGGRRPWADEDFVS